MGTSFLSIAARCLQLCSCLPISSHVFGSPLLQVLTQYWPLCEQDPWQFGYYMAMLLIPLVCNPLHCAQDAHNALG